MKHSYLGQTGFNHGRPAKIGIILVNLGTPTSPEPAALRAYLGEFLSDSRVVEIPRLLWKLILHGVILRLRPKKSARTYARIWTEQGSPLMALSLAMTEKVVQRLSNTTGRSVSVHLAMRYGEPAIDKVLKGLQQKGAEHLLVLPLYPQYAGATTGSVADAVFASLGRWRWVPELHLMGAYHDDRRYIQAISHSIQSHWQENGQGDKLVISFHGMPKATLLAGDPYFCHCHKTARLIAEDLGLEPKQWEMAFQSRFGRAEWLQPYLAERLRQLPSEGIHHVNVVCPGFAVDCVETLEEINMEGRDIFMAAGGDTFEYVPALNDQQAHVELHSDRLQRQIDAILAAHDEHRTDQQPHTPEQTYELAIAAGANR